jgi:hypothetical protein
MSEPATKFTVDYESVETGEEGWTGILYPTRANAEWTAEYLRATRPDLKHVRVEVIQCHL